MLTQVLNELTAHRIARKADRRTKERADTLPSKLIGLSGNVLTFVTHRWAQKVQLLGLRSQLDRVRDGKKKIRAAVGLAMRKDIRVSCNCPSMLYGGFAYIATEGGFKVGAAQTRFPKIRNPGLRGSVCKHLVRVLEDLPGREQVVTRLVKRQMEVEES